MRGIAPKVRACSDRGFTLVELLVVIGIIAVLIGILLPVLSKAREAGNTIKCAANLRSVGQGMMLYVSENKGTYPAAYIYEGMIIQNGKQTPDAAVNGYVHWSAFLYGDRSKVGDSSIFLGVSGWDAFTCPSIDKGGLPPTNTYSGNLDDGQANDNGAGVVDWQAPRLAYTVNEAICPRNKFVLGFQGARRAYQFVRAGSVRNAAETVLATEWNPNWRIVADSGRSNPNDSVCKSHRPVHGFKGLAGELNMDQIPPDPFSGRPTYTRCSTSDLTNSPEPGDSATTRLDWVGRNHGKKRDGFDDRRSNFLYCDGHVETKSVKETLEPFQWGEVFYSLNPHGDIVR